MHGYAWILSIRIYIYIYIEREIYIYIYNIHTYPHLRLMLLIMYIRSFSTTDSPWDAHPVVTVTMSAGLGSVKLGILAVNHEAIACEDVVLTIGGTTYPPRMWGFNVNSYVLI